MSAVESSEESGEGYFASVSDLMVGVLFVFLLMLTVFALNFRQKEEDQTVKLKELTAALYRAEQAERAAEEARQEARRQGSKAAEAFEEAKRQQQLALRERQAADAAKEEARAQERRAILAQREAMEQHEIAQRERAAADEQRRNNENLRELLHLAVERLQQELKSREAARRRLLADLKDTLEKNGIKVEIDPESGVLRLPEQLLFDSGQANLKGEAKENLHKLASALDRVLPCFTAANFDLPCTDRDPLALEAVLIEGHADRQGYARLTAEQSRERNDRLAVDRALTVFKELRQTRPRLDELRNRSDLPLVAVSAYGERRPIDAGDNPAAYQKNRRIDLRFVLSSRTSDELQKLIDEIRPALDTRQ